MKKRDPLIPATPEKVLTKVGSKSLHSAIGGERGGVDESEGSGRPFVCKMFVGGERDQIRAWWSQQKLSQSCVVADACEDVEADGLGGRVKLLQGDGHGLKLVFKFEYIGSHVKADEMGDIRYNVRERVFVEGGARERPRLKGLGRDCGKFRWNCNTYVTTRLVLSGQVDVLDQTANTPRWLDPYLAKTPVNWSTGFDINKSHLLRLTSVHEPDEEPQSGGRKSRIV
ncbi:hypothetical protein K435DRAFT_793859 [Dendrothele bispora CBS 962.96]|uniref:Uncharacterized protein n=1 Tax=Dendrothele bispora (strain CBS 962.96) TaxID=1314807 RepID=A0A4S8MDZ1_DENBC|nr:hypothetical protein K435DRAFT_793859 [Dendrothele bispora CBS 962.96]